jgi:hypothetical protein
MDNVGNRQVKDSAAEITFTLSQALPLTWISFTGKMLGEKVQLNWTTANEINTSHFDVEKSTDGITYTKIAAVLAWGNTGGDNNYTSFDEHPSNGNNYYRLKQFDIDGKSAYSSIVKVYYGKNGTVIIAPNPANDYVEIRGTVNLTQIQLIDAMGRIVMTFAPSANNMYSLSGINPGVYVIRLIAGKEAQTHKLLIQ